jgi:hypothetical protein
LISEPTDFGPGCQQENENHYQEMALSLFLRDSCRRFAACLTLGTIALSLATYAFAAAVAVGDVIFAVFKVARIFEKLFRKWVGTAL